MTVYTVQKNKDTFDRKPALRLVDTDSISDYDYNTSYGRPLPHAHPLNAYAAEYQPHSHFASRPKVTAAFRERTPVLRMPTMPAKMPIPRAPVRQEPEQSPWHNTFQADERQIAQRRQQTLLQQRSPYNAPYGTRQAPIFQADPRLAQPAVRRYPIAYDPADHGRVTLGDVVTRKIQTLWHANEFEKELNLKMSKLSFGFLLVGAILLAILLVFTGFLIALNTYDLGAGASSPYENSYATSSYVPPQMSMAPFNPNDPYNDGQLAPANVRMPTADENFAPSAPLPLVAHPAVQVHPQHPAAHAQHQPQNPQVYAAHPSAPHPGYAAPYPPRPYAAQPHPGYQGRPAQGYHPQQIQAQPNGHLVPFNPARPPVPQQPPMPAAQTR